MFLFISFLQSRAPERRREVAKDFERVEQLAALGILNLPWNGGSESTVLQKRWQRRRKIR